LIHKKSAERGFYFYLDTWYFEKNDKMSNLRNIYLFDLDAVINLFYKAFYASFAKKFPNQEIIPPAMQPHWHVEHCYPDIPTKEIVSIWQEPGFFYSMDPFPGAIETVKKLMETNHVAIVSHVPSDDYFTQIKDEKLAWLWKVFDGKPPILQAVEDKSEISGDILVDDKPRKLIKCSRSPDWVHIQFVGDDYKYNRELLPTDRGDLTANWENMSIQIQRALRVKEGKYVNEIQRYPVL